MNACTIVALLSFSAAAVLLFQRLSLKKQHAGYKTIQDAIEQESMKLTVLRESQKAVEHATEAAASNAREEEAKTAAAVGQRLSDESTIAKHKTSIAEFVSAAERARIDMATTRNELTSATAKLDILQKQRDELAASVAELNTQKLAIASRVSHLLSLEARESTLRTELESLENSIQQSKSKSLSACNALDQQLIETRGEVELAQQQVNLLMGQIDLYSRVDEYTRVGHFEIPNYLYDTSIRYQSEIKEVRERQRKLIRDKEAVTYPNDLMLCINKSLDKKVLDGQVQLMLGAFNIECDLLIEKVNPGNFDRTLQQIEKKAEGLEKCCGTLKCGFNSEYVRMKFEECKLQFEFTLRKKEEQEEQRMIREQMREEVRVQKQYEEAVKEAEREEAKYMRLLERARDHLTVESSVERSVSQAKIDLLEEQLKEAQERRIRAKSMAEQTRRGFVYVISNVGAFGEGIFKIGLTRRLDPQERVDELSSASVPFPFDIHAMCYSEDAPALEHALHQRFSNHRVNAVNFRKEFFRVDLGDIQAAIEDMVDDTVEFTVTAKAEDYFQSKRLLAA